LEKATDLPSERLRGGGGGGGGGGDDIYYVGMALVILT
jgi:hypothetical protein